MHIVPMDAQNRARLDETENRHLDAETVVLRLTHGGLSLDFRPKSRAQWRQPLEVLQERPAPDALLTPGLGAAFFAMEGKQLLGQVVVCPHAHRLARVCDARVALASRKQGVGRALLRRAEGWAWDHGHVGLLFETPDDNPGACQFIQRCGFRLGGVDLLRYTGMPGRIGGMDALCEAVLSFYKFFT